MIIKSWAAGFEIYVIREYACASERDDDADGAQVVVDPAVENRLAGGEHARVRVFGLFDCLLNAFEHGGIIEPLLVKCRRDQGGSTVPRH